MASEAGDDGSSRDAVVLDFGPRERTRRALRGRPTGEGRSGGDDRVHAVRATTPTTGRATVVAPEVRLRPGWGGYGLVGA
jgi:hypothetical protein